MTEEIKYINVSYDFIDNGEGELMMVMDAPEDVADDDNAKFLFDGVSKAMLVRQSNQILNVSIVREDVRDLLNSIKIILVTEMDGDNIDDVYEAQVEIVNPLPYSK